MVQVDESSHEVTEVTADRQLLKNHAQRTSGLLGKWLKDKRHECEDTGGHDDGYDLMPGPRGKEEADRYVEGTEEDQADVVAQQQFGIDVTVHRQDDGVEEQRSDQCQEKRERAEEFAQHDFRFADRHGHKRFNRAVSEFVTEQAHRQHRHNEGQYQDDPEIKQKTKRCFSVYLEDAEAEYEA